MARRPAMSAIASHPPLRLALTALWAVGTVLAAGAAVVTSVGHDAGGAGEYAVTTALLLALAIATAQRSRKAIALGIVLCALQPVAVVATAWELTHQIPGAQAAKIRALEVDPTVGVALNLFLAGWASLLSVWAYRVARRGSVSR
jgi:hypothetical protein